MQCYPYVNAVVQNVNRCVTDVVTTIALGYKNVVARILKNLEHFEDESFWRFWLGSTHPVTLEVLQIKNIQQF